MSVQHWHPAVGLGGYSYMEETSEEGDDIFVRFTDHKSSLAASEAKTMLALNDNEHLRLHLAEKEQRIAKLEEACEWIKTAPHWGSCDAFLFPGESCDCGLDKARAALAATEGGGNVSRDEYRLPDGTCTKDVEDYVETYRALMAPIAKITSSGRYGYDPDCTFQWRHQLVDIPADFVKQINDALSAERARREKAEEVLDAIIANEGCCIQHADESAQRYRAQYPRVEQESGDE